MQVTGNALGLLAVVALWTDAHPVAVFAGERDHAGVGELALKLPLQFFRLALALESANLHAPSAARVVRFSGEAVLADPCTPFPELEKLVKEIIGPLAAQADVSLTVRVEIDASHAGAAGFSDKTIRDVSENAKTLRLRKFDFEKE